MIRVNVFVEGQTEETFLRELLVPYFVPMQIFLTAIIVRTSAVSKGGLVSYAKIKPQLVRKSLEDKTAFVSTMFDLFHLPPDFPGTKDASLIQDPLEKASCIEERMRDDLQMEKFIPNLLVHEFEGLLYSEPACFVGWFDDVVVETLALERKSFESPEHINDGPETAPSKRIMKVCPSYDKPVHGALIALDIGLDRMRKECLHFDGWLTRLTNLDGAEQM